MDRKITALKVQKRNPNRINIYLDDIFAFGLARIVAAWLQVGQILSEERIIQLQQQDSEEAAYQKAMRLLSDRMRSQSEIEEKLARQGFSQQEISGVIQRLVKSGLLGDEQFASDWVENRATFRPRSRRILTMELRQKGVSEEVVQRTLAGIADESTLAYQAARRYARRLDPADWQNFRKRLTAYLGRRGFSYETVAPIVKRVWDELQPANENQKFGENEELNDEISIG